MSALTGNSNSNKSGNKTNLVFLYHVTKDNINVCQTCNLIFSLVRNNQELAEQVQWEFKYRTSLVVFEWCSVSVVELVKSHLSDLHSTILSIVFPRVLSWYSGDLNNVCHGWYEESESGCKLLGQSIRSTNMGQDR